MTGPGPRPPVGSFAWVAGTTVIVLALLALFWLMARLSIALLLLFGAIVIASILLSAAGLVQRLAPLGPKLSLAIAGFSVTLLLVVIAYFLGSQVVSGLSMLIRDLPSMVNDLGARFGVENPLQQIPGWERWAGDVFGYVPNVASALTALILVIFGGIFFAVSPEMYREGVVKLIPRQHRDIARRTLVNCGRALQLWLIGKLIAMAVIGAATTIGLLLLGIPTAFALGFLAGLLEFIPVVGAILAFFPAGAVALSQSSESFWWVLGLYVLIQQIESNVLVPVIQKRTVQLPPVLGLFAIIAMGSLFGPLGVVLGVPLTVVVLIAVKQVYVRNILGEEVSVPGEKSEDSDGGS